MNKRTAQKRKKDRGERKRIDLKKQRERLELEELQAEAEESLMDEPIEKDEDAEEVEKYYGDSLVGPYPAPTSFDELDAARDAAKKAHEVNEVTWDVQDLVRNILNDMEMVPTEKADRMMDVADGFADRVNKVMMDSEDMQKDMDVLQIEAILGSYERGLNLIEKATDFMQDMIVKRQLTGNARKRLADSDFALPGKRKYPIHDKAHVRNALARAAQMIKAGGEAADDAKAALPKIRKAAKEFGIEMGMEKSSIIIEKDQKDDWRWIGKPSNNFIDKQGDIMSKAAHERYVDWLDENTELAPLFMKWHTPGTAREHAADFWMEHEGALIMSGKLTETEAGQLLKMQAQTDLGMSVAGTALRLNADDPREITHYWLYEVSDLPLEKAANPFTSFETIAKEAGMDKLQYLTDMMGSEEKAKAYLQKTGEKQKELKDAGLTSKAEDEETPVAETQPVAEVTETVVEKTAKPAPDAENLTKQIVAAVGEEFDIQGLNAFVAKAQESFEKVSLLEGMVKELQGTREDELVEMLQPPVAKFAWSQEARPSASDDNKINKETDKDLMNAKPGVDEEYWLSEVTQTAPVME